MYFKHSTAIIFLLVFTFCKLFSQEPEVITGITQTILSFENNAVFTDNSGEIAEEKVTELRNICKDNAISISNIFTPMAVTYPNPISLEEYIQIIRHHYLSSFNIKINFSKDKIGSPVKFSKNQYQCVVETKMQTLGLFFFADSKQSISTNDTMWFVVEYTMKLNKPSNFKIYSINNSEPKISPYVKQKKTKASETKMNFALGLNPQVSKIQNSNFKENGYTSSYQPSFSAHIKVLKPLKSPQIKLYFGLGFSKINTVISSSQSIGFDNDMLRIDIDNDEYYLGLNASIEERHDFTYLDIPIGINWYFSKNRKSGLFIKSGINIQYLLESNSSVSGDYTSQGYYPEYHVVLFDIPTYGFETKTLNEDIEWEPSKTNFNLNLGIGYRIAPKNWNKGHIELTIESNLGLSDLEYDKPKYTFDYNSLYGSPSATKINSFGLSVEYHF